MGWLAGWGPRAATVSTDGPARGLEAAAPVRWPPAHQQMAPFTVSLPSLDAYDGWPLTRAEVWLVPAVAQGLQVIAGTVGTLPFTVSRGRESLEVPGLLRQPDPEEPAHATFTALVEDLVLFPEAYGVVLARDSAGKPAQLRYVPHEIVEPFDWTDPADPYAAPIRQFRVGGYVVAARDVIRFPSHWPGLLIVGARALRTAITLERAAAQFATIEIPPGYLKNNGPDMHPDKVTELLDGWSSARRARQTGYLNALLDYVVPSFNPEQLQLVEARKMATAEVGRLLNLPSRYLNAPSESSMTYSNVESERRDLVDLSLRPYVASLEGRLSLDDVVPRGQTVALELDDFYRGDMGARSAYYAAGLAGGWLTADEVRAAEGYGPLPRGAANAV